MRLRVRSLALLSGLMIFGVAASYGVGRRRGSDPVLLWLWHRLAVTAPIQPLAWEPPHAAGAAKQMAPRPEEKKEKKKQTQTHL